MNQSPLAFAFQEAETGGLPIWIILLAVVIILFLIVVVVAVGVTIFFIMRKRRKAQTAVAQSDLSLSTGPSASAYAGMAHPETAQPAPEPTPAPPIVESPSPPMNRHHPPMNLRRLSMKIPPQLLRLLTLLRLILRGRWLSSERIRFQSATAPLSLSLAFWRARNFKLNPKGPSSAVKALCRK